MNITRIALERNRVTVIALLVVIGAGITTYIGMPRAEDPGFIIRTAVVTTQFPGASPERVEQLVTDKLEKVIQEIPELDFVSSTSKAGLSVINVNVREEFRRMRPIWDDLRRKVESARVELPTDVIGPTVDDEFGDVFGFVVGIRGPDFSYRELKTIADEVRDELLLIPDAAKVEIAGAQDERIFVEYNNARLAAIGLSPMQLKQILEARNIVQPGGELRLTYETVVLEPSGSFNEIEELKRAVIIAPGRGEVVRLEDIATVYRGYIDPPRALTRVNGESALLLSVSMRDGGNNIELGTDIREVTDRAHAIYPIGVDFIFIQDQSQIVEKKISEFEVNLLQAIGIVVAVMIIFLGLRTGFIVATLIPVSIIAAFPIMNSIGIGLDQMSLASLIIALGMLVDNAIVMSESIMVRMQNGEESRAAAIASAKELRVPLLTSSLTTSAAFLPIFLSESNTGEYTASLFKVVTITLLSSWVLALTLVPLMCVMFMRVKRRTEDAADGFIYRAYRGVLKKILRHPWFFLAGVGCVFYGAIAAMALIPNIFFPPNDRATFTMEVELPVGTPLKRTEAVVLEIENYMAANHLAREGQAGIEDWASFIGKGAPRFNLTYNPNPANSNYSIGLVNVTNTDAMLHTIIPALREFVFENFPDAEATIRPLELGAPAWPPVAIRVSGRETDRLFDLVDDIKARLRETPGAIQITDNWGTRTKKAAIRIDDTRARLAGVTHQDIALSLQTYFSGIDTTDYREDDKLIPITLRSDSAINAGNEPVGSINVYVQSTGQSVPFNQVADVDLVFQPATIERRNRLRTVTIEALLQPGYTSSAVLAAIDPWLKDYSADWSFGYGWEYGGEAETSGKANTAIAAKLPIAALIIVLLLVAQFNSLRRPAIILLTIPLSLVGVTAGLLIANSYFGFMTLLGIISLAGIVINNAIVLIDRIDSNITERGMAAAESILVAAQQRLRPILLTTATTIGGMLPLWLGGGPMWEPMAISIIFGLAFATVLTLGVVPVLYTLFFRVRHA
ncbi:MAG: efflux RND transporter permease subunit [Pseudomonadota bacterium]